MKQSDNRTNKKRSNRMKITESRRKALAKAICAADALAARDNHVHCVYSMDMNCFRHTSEDASTIEGRYVSVRFALEVYGDLARRFAGAEGIAIEALSFERYLGHAEQTLEHWMFDSWLESSSMGMR
jgi:hypothetical protein